MLFNALDYPACVFPVTTVDPQLDRPAAPHKFLSEADKAIFELCESTLTCTGVVLFIPLLFGTDDDPSTFKNAPVALQLVGRTQEEEAVIAMTEIVDAALKAKKA